MDIPGIDSSYATALRSESATVSTSRTGGAFKVLGGWQTSSWKEPVASKRSLRMPSTTLWHGYYSRRRPSNRDRPERVANDVENVDHPWVPLLEP